MSGDKRQAGETSMLFHGHVENGVVVFDEPVSLPEGTKVCVEPVNGKASLIRPGTGDWEAAAKAAQALRETGYDFDAFRRQREYDLEHANDHLP
jgi:hypothetical protein